MKLRTIIADDEPLARERLRFLLSSHEEVFVVGECRNGRETVAALKERRIDVLFLDIQMPGRGGFEVLEQVGPAHMPVTVFVTAHNQYAIKAFEVHALDYLTKPVEPERLQATLGRVKERVASSAALSNQEQLKSVLESLGNGVGAKKEYPKRLLVPGARKDSFVDVNEIEWIEAADYYCCPACQREESYDPRDDQAARGDPRSREIRPHSPLRHRERGEGARDLSRGAQRRLGEPRKWTAAEDE